MHLARAEAPPLNHSGAELNVIARRPSHEVPSERVLMEMAELAGVTPISDGTARRSDEQVGAREVYVEHHDRRVGGTRGDRSLAVWPCLRTIARNLASNHDRRRDAHQVEDLGVDGRLIDMPSADADMDNMVVLHSPLGSVIEDAAGAQGWNVADSAESLGLILGPYVSCRFRAGRKLRAATKMSCASARQGRSSCGGRRVQPVVDVRPSDLGG